MSAFPPPAPHPQLPYRGKPGPQVNPDDPRHPQPARPPQQPPAKPYPAPQQPYQPKS